MSYFLQWIMTTIADTATDSGEVDLTEDCDFVQVIIPAITSCTLKVTVCKDSGGTFVDLGSGVTTATTTGAYATTFKLGGYRYIKIVSSVAQSSGDDFWVRGYRI